MSTQDSDEPRCGVCALWHISRIRPRISAARRGRSVGSLGMIWPNNIKFTTMQPMISVVIPAYNEEKRLRASVLSVMAAAKAAGGTPIEIIVVDDGSRDG